MHPSLALVFLAATVLACEENSSSSLKSALPQTAKAALASNDDDENAVIPAAPPHNQSPAKIGMNDISIMMPLDTLPTLAKVLPRLTDKPDPQRYAAGLPAADLDAFAFVPDWAESQRNKHLSEGLAPVSDKLGEFVMTSIRFDPCSNHLQIQASGASCVSEMRIVWQQMESSATGLKILDSNVHTLYTLSDEEFREVLKTLGQLHAEASIETLGLFLQPNPVIAKEGVDSPYLKGVIGLVHRYARASKLSEIANMIGHNPVDWSLGHIAVENSQAKVFPIPTLDATRSLDRINLSFNLSSFVDPQDGSSAFFVPHLANDNKIGRLTENNLIAASDMPEDVKREVENYPVLKNIIEGFAVDNPKLFNPKNINCSTCHLSFEVRQAFKYLTATVGNKVWDDSWDRPSSLEFWRGSSEKVSRARDRLPEEGKALDIASFAAIYGYQSSKWDLSTPFAPMDDNTLQLFSFRPNNKPSIASRVVNDTAESLSLIESMGMLSPIAKP